MSTLKQAAQLAGVHLPETYLPSIDDAISSGDGILMEEQAKLLRECRTALDDLLNKKPTLATLVCGYTTLGNLRAMLFDYRPQGVFGVAPEAKP